MAKNIQNNNKKGIMVIFKGDGSLDALFSRFLERLNVLWIPHMSGYPMDLIKLIRENDDFKGAKGQAEFLVTPKFGVLLRIRSN